MFFPFPQTDELACFAYLADKEARSDLLTSHIRDEDDYTSNLTGALRRNINTHSLTGLSATSYLLPTSDERRTGCDAAIILHYQGAVKVALFEAKLPRFLQRTSRWDKKQTASGLSHFSDQLARQGALRNNFVIFEMFYCEYPFGAQPSGWHDDLSSCVWHRDARAFDATRSGAPGVWSDGELHALVQQSYPLTLVDVLIEMCACREGTSIPWTGGLDVFALEFALEGHVLVIDAAG